MKPNKRTLERLKATIKDSTAVERSLNQLISKYSFELVRYVTNRIIETEVVKRKLEQKMRDAEQKLAELKQEKAK